MLDTLHALEATQVGTLVRESLYGFPILVGLHILGLTLSVGMMLWFDLRLLGVALTTAPVTRVYRRLIPWASAGFVVMLVTGSLLFTGYAASAWGSPYFRVKVAALVLAGFNALVYHRSTERGIARWDADVRPPRAARLAGAASLLAWALVILCGRMMAYTMY
ncbi:MAG: DUF6644 family protein [Vicinamibacterales bacterium]